MIGLRVTTLLAAIAMATPTFAAEVTITVHAGKSDSPNYVLAKQFSEALALAGNGAYTLLVAES